jgi:O-6-methylguanine DNA methyltransferase
MRNADREDILFESLASRLSAPPGLADRLLRVVRGRGREDLGSLVARCDISASPAGIVRLRLGRGRLGAPTGEARVWVERARLELAQYLVGARSYFTVPVDLSSLTGFQRAVLAMASEIPFGEVRPYRWVAERIGHPAAARAVGTALGDNPVPILVPCHRVLRSDGSLGGYLFGLSLKGRLLALERDTPALVGCTTTRIVCRRGCGREQRVGEDRRIVLASVKGARALGYRPCKVCRPAKIA